jgi:hypothetical protein
MVTVGGNKPLAMGVEDLMGVGAELETTLKNESEKNGHFRIIFVTHSLSVKLKYIYK